MVGCKYPLGKYGTAGFPLVLFLLMFSSAMGQGNPKPPSLHDLLRQAETNYPFLKSKMLEVQASEKGIAASHSTLIPTLDASYQASYATYNNITGMAQPQYLIPISGPPSPDNRYNGVFGSAASLLLNWQPVTFGQRDALMDYSETELQHATADFNNEIFEHKVKVIGAYLDALEASELVRVHEGNYVRAEASLSVTKTLVISGIRPGVDTASCKAEISRARIDLLNSQKLRQQTLIALSHLVASDNAVPNDTSYFRKLPKATTMPEAMQHPLLALSFSSIELGKARRKMIDRTMMPTLGVWGTGYARGSGISFNGAVNPAQGLYFQRFNYGLGIQLSMPLLQFARVQPKLQQQDFLVRSSQERLNDVSLQLRKQLELADTTLNLALAIAKEIPHLTESAQFSFDALRSRYESGLANYADLVQAQYMLIKAEVESKTAYIQAWKALLYKAAVTGDLDLFLNQVD